MTSHQRALKDLMDRIDGLEPEKQATIRMCSSLIKLFASTMNTNQPGAGNIGLMMATLQTECELENELDMPSKVSH